MNSKQIQAAVDQLVVDMMAKGLRQPSAHLQFNANAMPNVGLKAGVWNEADYWYSYPAADTIEQAIDEARAIIAAMPKVEDARLRNHMRRVADCIDKGREDGIDDAYITPLVAVKAAMTENLLAKPVAL